MRQMYLEHNKQSIDIELTPCSPPTLGYVSR